MSVRIQLPPVLRAVSGGERVVEANGGTIAEVLRDVSNRQPAFALHFFDEAGAIRRNIIFLHGGMLVRAPDASAHRVVDGDEIVLTNALAGG